MGTLGRIESIAQWWAQASEKARYDFLAKATQEGAPTLGEIQIAAFLAEAEQGTVSEG